MTKSAEQFNRVLRWYKRFEEINNGTIHDRSSDFYQDLIYAFFQNCHHLKDWISKDDENQLSEKCLDQFIDSHYELKIAAALCIGSKHLEITNKHFDKNTEIEKRDYKVGVGNGAVSISIKFTIYTSSGRFDAFDIATRCIILWRQFFNLNNL